MMCIKGFVNRLSHDCHIDIDHDVSTVYCRSSSGHSVDLLSRTIVPPCLLVIDVSRTLLIVGGFRSKALLVLLEEETIPSVVRCSNDWMLCRLIVSIHASGISIPLSLLMLLG